MKILNLHERTELKGGAEVYVDQLNQLLPKYGHESFWIGQDSLGQDWRKPLSDCIKKNDIDIINIHNIFNPEFVSFCLNELPVVKFSHSPVMVCPGGEKFWRYSQRPCEIKYGLHCFRHIYTQGCANRHPKRVMKAWNNVNFEVKTASTQYKKIVVMSDYIKNGLLECGIEDERILCNPYFTTPMEYKPSNWNADSKRILYIGRLISSKGPQLLVAAFDELLKVNRNLFLDIIGDGMIAEELQTLVKTLGIENHVVFHGWLNRAEINKKLDDCFLLAFPSIYPEAFGITGIEAMMSSKPVIGFDTGGVGTWLKNGETGYLVERGNARAMAEKIQSLIDDRGVYINMSKRANEYALAHFSPDVHMKKLLAVYDNCLVQV